MLVAQRIRQTAMQHSWQSLRELLWPSRHNPVAGEERRIALIQALLAIAIAVAAGPEIFAAAEMTALMELLGATLFLTAMGAGARLLALNMWDAFCRFALPAPQAAVLRSDASIAVKVFALGCVAVYAAWSLVLVASLRGRFS